ncbi:MAG: ABC transporter substrate-binding protein [Oscillospiraceae bacterium]|jgi:putative aldouronate transport system substrate-binding protein|nr:ABC transporter substrate-binding protein [Oscillospiraceae bacterium]
MNHAYHHRLRIATTLLFLLAAIGLPIRSAVAFDEPVYFRLTVPLFFEAEIPQDIGMIQEMADRLAKERIGASARLVPLLYLSDFHADPLRVSELNMLAKQGVTMDIYPNILPDRTPIVLNELLWQYGQDIIDLLEDRPGSQIGSADPLRKLVSINDYVYASGVTMRRDLVEQYGIDLSSIHTYFDLDAVFALVKAHEPDLYMICPYQTRASLIRFDKTRMTAGFSFLDVSPNDSDMLVNYYAEDGYRELVALFRKWRLAGYLPESLALQNLRASHLVDSGELFAYTCAYKPGIDYEESNRSGREMVTVAMTEPIITSGSLNITSWHIADDCKNPGKAMQFLNMLYTDPELSNLLLYGIEGVHYVTKDDGTLSYPDGVTAQTVGYQNTLGWLLPNQTLSPVWEGNDPDLWKHLRIFDETAPVSDTLEFTFDPGAMSATYQNVLDVVLTYSYGLETGQLDPDVYLPRMLAEMEAAGSSAILNIAQEQFSSFRARQEAKAE